MSKGYVDEIVGGDGKRRYTLIKSDGTRENGVVIEKDYIPQQEGSKFGSKEVNGGVYLEAIASYSEGIVAIDAPEGAKMIVFTAPSDFNDTDTYTLNGSPVTLLDMNKEQLSDAWKAGVPVTLTVSGGSCFFKGGGQGFPAGWNEKGQGIAWDDITQNSPIVQREYGKIEDGLNLPPQLTDPPSYIVQGCDFSSDGKYLAVSHSHAPFLTIYKMEGEAWIKIPGPTSPPAGLGYECAFCPTGGYLSVAHLGSPYITIYKQQGDVFTKLPNPDVLPTNDAYGCAFSPDGLHLGVAYTGTPNVTVYKRNGDTFSKLPNPAVLPPGDAESCCFSLDGAYMAVTAARSPYIAVYRRTGDVFTKLADPAMPQGGSYCCSFSPDGLYLAITSYASPYIAIYKRNGDTFTRLPNPNVVPSGYGRACQFSRDGKYLAVSAASSPWLYLYKRDGDVFTKLPDPEGLPTITRPYSVFGGIAFSTRDEYLAWGYTDAPYITIYLNEQKTYIHTLNDINKEYFEYAPKGKIGVAKESKPAGELVKATLFPALYNLTNNGNGGN